MRRCDTKSEIQRLRDEIEEVKGSFSGWNQRWGISVRLIEISGLEDRARQNARADHLLSLTKRLQARNLIGP